MSLISLISYEFNRFNELKNVMLHHLSYDSEYVSRKFINLLNLLNSLNSLNRA